MPPIPDRARSQAFTLIEVLMVIVVIAILAVLALTVGAKVAGSAKVSATKERLKQLDSALNAYFKAKGGYPPSYVADPRSGPLQTGNVVIPIIDGQYIDASSPPLNTVGLFMLQCKGLPEVERAWSTLGTDALREVDPDNTAADPAPVFNKQPKLLTVLDAWGRPIRYVHPTFHGYVYEAGNVLNPIDVDNLIEPGVSGKQLTFTISPVLRHPTSASPAKPANADGGLTTGGRPYFYSAGPDGDPSTTDDNVYLNEPSFQKVS
jgi:prepilin-type N-terminal cleavage/methylation domain-containing protein